MEYAWQVLKSQKKHVRIKRERRNVVFNTSRDNCLSSKQGTHPKRFQHNQNGKIIYVRVNDGDTLAPIRFFLVFFPVFFCVAG